MPRRLRWSELGTGLISLAAIIAVVLGVLLFARVGALRGETIELYMTTAEARGIIEGSEVWLGGQRVGLVAGVRFLPVTTDTTDRVLLELDVLEKYHEQIRRDSFAQIRAGGTLIGAQVVHITIGTADAPVLSSGDTIHALRQPDTEGVASQVARAGEQFPEIIANVKLLTAQMRSAEGTLGAVLSEENGDAIELGILQERITGLAHDVTEGEGTIGLVLQREKGLLDRASSAVARADSIRQLLASDRGSLGRFRRDSTLLREIADVRYDLAVVSSLLDRSSGTAGRVVNDSIIPVQLSRLDAELGDLIDDIKARPLRYLRF